MNSTLDLVATQVGVFECVEEEEGYRREERERERESG